MAFVNQREIESKGIGLIADAASDRIRPLKEAAWH